jgi:hypothetical protein
MGLRIETLSFLSPWEIQKNCEHKMLYFLQLTKSSQLRVAFQESGRMTVPTITHLKILRQLPGD